MALRKQKGCMFCKKKVTTVDYKDGALLVRQLGMWNKMKAGKSLGTCAKHQRMLTTAIKRARAIALLSSTRK